MVSPFQNTSKFLISAIKSQFGFFLSMHAEALCIVECKANNMIIGKICNGIGGNYNYVFRECCSSSNQCDVNQGVDLGIT